MKREDVGRKRRREGGREVKSKRDKREKSKERKEANDMKDTARNDALKIDIVVLKYKIENCTPNLSYVLPTSY